jgi:zinc transport system permease protein
MDLAWPEFLQLPQMRRAFLIAIIVGPACGALGTFVTLRRMSLMSDAVSHASLTGVTLGLALNIAREVHSPMLQVVLVVFCVAVAVFMTWLSENTRLLTDNVIALSYAGSVALGVILISRLRNSRALESTLFGDILAARAADVWVIGAVCAAAVGFVLANMRALTLSAVQENLANVEGFRVRALSYGFAVVLALVIALLLQQLGALLISGVLVVPPASSRLLSRNFRGMFLGAAMLGLAGAAAGVAGSYHFDAPTGPSIVLANAMVFTVCLLWTLLRARMRRAKSP